MLFSSNRTATALAEEFIPCLLDTRRIAFHYRQQIAQHSRIKAVIISQPYRVQPKFCVNAILDDMNMNWLSRISFICVEQETEAVLSKKGWHGAMMYNMRDKEVYRLAIDLADRLRPLQEEILTYPQTGLPADKNFFDSLCGEDILAATHSPPSLSGKME